MPPPKHPARMFNTKTLCTLTVLCARTEQMYPNDIQLQRKETEVAKSWTSSGCVMGESWSPDFRRSSEISLPVG